MTRRGLLFAFLAAPIARVLGVANVERGMVETTKPGDLYHSYKPTRFWRVHYVGGGVSAWRSEVVRLSDGQRWNGQEWTL